MVAEAAAVSAYVADDGVEMLDHEVGLGLGLCDGFFAGLCNLAC